MTIEHLIEELETTGTARKAMLFAFDQAERLLIKLAPMPEDFERHLSQARRSKSNDRARRYMMLAALSLIHEDHLWAVGHRGDVQPGRFLATIMPVGKTFEGEAVDPALAVLRAVLRQRVS